jgi:hypothetical protein
MGHTPLYCLITVCWGDARSKQGLSLPIAWLQFYCQDAQSKQGPSLPIAAVQSIGKTHDPYGTYASLVPIYSLSGGRLIGRGPKPLCCHITVYWIWMLEPSNKKWTNSPICLHLGADAELEATWIFLVTWICFGHSVSALAKWPLTKSKYFISLSK